MGPVKSDFDEFQRELFAPVKSIRLFAMETALREGDTPECVRLLASRAEVETDEECRLLLAHAIAAVRFRIDPSSKAEQVAVDTPKTWLDGFSTSLPGRKLQLLESLTPVLTRELAPEFTKLSLDREDPIVVSAAIRVFQRFWPPERIPVFETLLGSTFLGVRIAALQALIHQAPGDLASHLPRLLLSTDPRLRGLAIRGLSGIDLPAALEHVEDMLASDDPWTRGCGLRVCLFLPFEHVREPLLRFLGAESSASLLSQAGAVLQANPDPQIPHRLLDLAETASGEKRRHLRKVFDGSLAAIRNSRGFSPEAFERFREDLQKRMRETVALRQVRYFIERFGGGEEKPQEADLAFFRNPPQPELAWALRKAKEWDLSPEGRSLLESLDLPPARPSKPDPFPADPAGFRNLSDGDILSRLQGAISTDREKVRGAVSCLLREPWSSPAVKGAVLRIAFREQWDEFVADAERCLASKDDCLVSASLDYLGEIDPERVFPLLGRFLNHPGKRVKMTSLSIFQRFDHFRAMGVLKALIGSVDHASQSQAVGCMVFFPFPLIRNLLGKQLGETTSPEILRQGLSLFLANPERENLALLLEIEKRQSGEGAGRAREARLILRRTLVEMGALSPDDPDWGELALEAAWNGKSRCPSVDSPFTIGALKETREKPTGDGIRGILPELPSSPLQNVAAIALFLLIIVTIGFEAIAFFEPYRSSPGVKAGGVLPRETECLGMVSSAGGDGDPHWTVSLESGELVHLDPVSDSVPSLRVGDRIVFRYLPVRLERDGSITGRLLDVKYLTSPGSPGGGVH